MARLPSLLLIPFFVLGQTLPHSHGGTGVVEPNGHELRPHVHVYSHGHGHSHDQHHEYGVARNLIALDGSIAPASDHDSNAIYLAAANPLLTRVAADFEIEAFSTDWVAAWIPIATDTWSLRRTEHPPDQYATVPIFLLTASLRL